MYCPYCGKKDTEIPGKCLHCGKEIKEVDKESEYECDECGKDVYADALYCWFCGNNVEEIVADESVTRLIYCPYCGKKDVETPGKCPHCGKDIKEADKESQYECDKCGKDVSADASYCWFCGNNVEEIVTDESVTTLMYCPYCGKKDVETPGKCPHCGKDIKVVEEIEGGYSAEQNRAQITRPDKVSKAVTLLYVVLGIGVLRSIMEVSRLPQIAIGFVILSLPTFGIIWLFIYKISKGRNWARITFLVLCIIGIPFSVVPLMQSLAANPFSGLFGIAQIIIQIVALVFLFQRPSSDWFREMKANK